VQAILGGAIALTALATRWRSGIAMRRPDQVAVVACVLGLLLVAGSAGGDAPESVGAVADLGLGGAVVVLAGVLVALRNCRAAWQFALVAGLGFGYVARGARRACPGGAGLDPGVLVAEPAVYLVLCFWMIGDYQLLAGAGARRHRRRHGRVRHHRGGGALAYRARAARRPGPGGLGVGPRSGAGRGGSGLGPAGALTAVRQPADHLRIHV
jgi:hypothetical protein